MNWLKKWLLSAQSDVSNMVEELNAPCDHATWNTTSVNRFQVPTKEVCTGCGLTRHADIKYSNGEALYFWKYSNGYETESIKL